MTLWAAVKLLLSLEEPIRQTVVEIAQALKTQDPLAARQALERALRIQFAARQELTRK